MSKAKKPMRAGNPLHPYSTLLQVRAKQMAWTVYLTEGYIAAMQAALERNAYTLNDAQLHAIERAQWRAKQSALDLRRILTNG